MAGALTAAQLKVVVGGETKDAEDKLKGLNKQVSDSKNFFKDALSSALGFAGAQIGIAGVGDAFNTVKGAITGVIDAAMKQQSVEAQLNAGIKSTRDASGETVKGLVDMATGFARLNPFSKTAIENSQAITLSFTNIGKNVFPQATQSAMDLATRMGMDLPNATLMLDKALADPLKGITALHREGVEFSASQKELIKTYMAHGETAKAQSIILAEMQKEFGGSAQAAGKTFAGALAIAGNQLDQVKETIGNAVLPVLSQLLSNLAPIISSLASQLPGAIDAVGKVVGPVFAQFQGALGSVTKGGGPLDLLQGMFKQMQPILGTVAGIFKDTLVPAFKALGPVVQALAGYYLAELQGIFSNIGPVLKIISDVLHNVILPVFQALADVVAHDVLPVMTQIMQTVMQQLVPAVLKLYVALEPVIKLVGALLVPALRLVGWILGNVVGPAIMLFINLLSGVITVVAAVVGAILSPFQWLADQLVGHSIIPDLINGIIGWFQRILAIPGQILGFVVTLLKHFGQLEIQGLQTIGRLALGILGFFASLPGKLADVGKQIVQGLISGITGMGGALGDAFHSLLSQITLPGGIHLPGFAEGGMVGGAPGSPQLIVAHGGEMVLPVGPRLAGIGGFGGYGGGGGGEQTIHVHVMLDGRQIAETVVRHVPSVIRNATGVRAF